MLGASTRTHGRGLEPRELLGRRHERDDEETVGAVAAPKEVERPALPVGGLDVEEREVVRRALERCHDAAHALDRRRAREERHDDPDDERAPQREVPRHGARA